MQRKREPTRDSVEKDVADNAAARQQQTADEGKNPGGRTLETVMNRNNGDMVTTASGDDAASSSILRPNQSVDPSTVPGKCAMPRGAGVLADEAAARGEPRPEILTEDGGHIIKHGEAVPIEACENCQAIKNEPANGIKTVGPKKSGPQVPPVVPQSGSDDDPEDEF